MFVAPHIFHQSNSRNHRSIFGSTNLKYIIAGIIFSITGWWIFKCFYPYPNLTFDSYYYIKAAVINTDVCGWPIGYAKFIRWLGLITHSANTLVSIQYFLLQISFIYFLITIRCIFLLNNISSIVIFVFLFINPLFPYACNHILSDLLYTSLSIIWATLLMWVIYRFKPYMVLVQALLVVMIFSLRYNAIFYPLISIFAFIVARHSWTWKILGIGLTVSFLWGFIEYTSIKMQETVGIRKYSYSGGWKLASSALYMYEYEFKDDHAPVPTKFKQIDSMVRKYYNEPHYIPSLYKADEEITLGSYYMAVDVSPLMQYMHYKYNDYEWSLDFHKTAPFGPFYQEYGLYLIKKHPFAYFKHVIMPQIVSYIIPYQEMFGIYLPPFTLWDDEYGQITRKWFELDTLMVPLPRIKARVFLLSPFPYIFALVHLVFFVSLIFFLLFKEYKKVSRLVFHSIILLALICIVNFLFVATTTTGVLRYQFFVVVLELGLIAVIFEIFFNFKVAREP